MASQLTKYDRFLGYYYCACAVEHCSNSASPKTLCGHYIVLNTGRPSTQRAVDQKHIIQVGLALKIAQRVLSDIQLPVSMQWPTQALPGHLCMLSVTILPSMARAPCIRIGKTTQGPRARTKNLTNQCSLLSFLPKGRDDSPVSLATDPLSEF